MLFKVLYSKKTKMFHVKHWYFEKNFKIFSTIFSLNKKYPTLDFEKMSKNVSRETLMKLFTVEIGKKKCYNVKAQ